MVVTSVEVTPVSCPFERNLSGSIYEKGRRETVVVTIRTDSGVTGRTYSGDFGDVGSKGRRRVVSFIRETIAPFLVERDLFSTERLWEKLFDESKSFPVWKSEERWFYVNALGAVDTALWDARGKALDVPLYELWGGYRDSLPIIGIGGYYEKDKNLEDLVEEIREFQDMGLAGVKMKVGKGTVQEDVDRLRAVREGLGSDFVIACDANKGWSVDDAVSFVRQANEYDLRWLEEPVEWHEQYRGMREVRRRTDVPVCAGQSEIVASGCRRLIDEDAIDILNFDASWGGGPTVWRKIAATADLHGVQMGHHEEPHLAMHLLASVPNGLFVECFHPDVDPVWYEMVANPPTVEDGTIHLPDGPGLGIELDQDFIDAHRLEE